MSGFLSVATESQFHIRKRWEGQGNYVGVQAQNLSERCLFELPRWLLYNNSTWADDGDLFEWNAEAHWVVVNVVGGTEPWAKEKLNRGKEECPEAWNSPALEKGSRGRGRACLSSFPPVNAVGWDLDP